MTQKAPDQRAYEAYFEAIGICYDAWDTLDDVERVPWQAASAALGETQLTGDILGDWPKILAEVSQQRDDLRTELERIARVGAASRSATARLLGDLARRALADG